MYVCDSFLMMLNCYSNCALLPWQCFEGLKAYHGVDGKIRLFRPMENMKRMNRSAVAASLPVRSIWPRFLLGGGGGGGGEGGAFAPSWRFKSPNFKTVRSKVVEAYNAICSYTLI